MSKCQDKTSEANEYEDTFLKRPNPQEEQAQRKGIGEKLAMTCQETCQLVCVRDSVGRDESWDRFPLHCCCEAHKP